MRGKRNFHLIYFVLMFIGIVSFQTIRILQIKSPVSNHVNDLSYLIYGALLLLIPLYIFLFIYLPSLLIVKITFSFPKFHFNIGPTPTKVKFNLLSDGRTYKSNFKLLCVMRY